MKVKGIYFWLFGLLLTTSACGGSGDEAAENDNSILISGDITGASGQKVTMWVYENDEQRIIDSAIVEDNHFELRTETNELREYIIEIGNPQQSLTQPINNLLVLFPDESASEIKITGQFPGVGDNYTLEGDENSKDYVTYRNFIQPYYNQLQSLNSQYQLAATPEEKEQLVAQMDSINLICRDYAVSFIDEKPASPISWMMLREFYPPSGLTNFDSTHLDYFKKVSSEMKAKYPYSEYPAYIDQQIENTLAQLAQLNSSAGGELAPELAFENPDGKVISLSSLKGKVVLIDFWASWCGPCRMENPNVVKVYDKYKNKGFTIYSVSLDQDKGKWTEAIKNDNLSWPNHVSDLKGWQSEAAAIYGVQSIPATFLIDQEGRIIDQNLRGDRLEQRLQEILG